MRFDGDPTITIDTALKNERIQELKKSLETAYATMAKLQTDITALREQSAKLEEIKEKMKSLETQKMIDTETIREWKDKNHTLRVQRAKLQEQYDQINKLFRDISEEFHQAQQAKQKAEALSGHKDMQLAIKQGVIEGQHYREEWYQKEFEEMEKELNELQQVLDAVIEEKDKELLLTEKWALDEMGEREKTESNFFTAINQAEQEMLEMAQEIQLLREQQASGGLENLKRVLNKYNRLAHETSIRIRELEQDLKDAASESTARKLDTLEQAATDILGDQKDDYIKIMTPLVASALDNTNIALDRESVTTESVCLRIAPYLLKEIETIIIQLATSHVIESELSEAKRLKEMIEYVRHSLFLGSDSPDHISFSDPDLQQIIQESQEEEILSWHTQANETIQALESRGLVRTDLARFSARLRDFQDPSTPPSSREEITNLMSYVESDQETQAQLIKIIIKILRITIQCEGEEYQATERIHKDADILELLQTLINGLGANITIGNENVRRQTVIDQQHNFRLNEKRETILETIKDLITQIPGINEPNTHALIQAIHRLEEQMQILTREREDLESRMSVGDERTLVQIIEERAQELFGENAQQFTDTIRQLLGENFKRTRGGLEATELCLRLAPRFLSEIISPNGNILVQIEKIVLEAKGEIQNEIDDLHERISQTPANQDNADLLKRLQKRKREKEQELTQYQTGLESLKAYCATITQLENDPGALREFLGKETGRQRNEGVIRNVTIIIETLVKMNSAQYTRFQNPTQEDATVFFLCREIARAFGCPLKEMGENEIATFVQDQNIQLRLDEWKKEFIATIQNIIDQWDNRAGFRKFDDPLIRRNEQLEKQAKETTTKIIIYAVLIGISAGAVFTWLTRGHWVQQGVELERQRTRKAVEQSSGITITKEGKFIRQSDEELGYNTYNFLDPSITCKELPNKTAHCKCGNRDITLPQQNILQEIPVYKNRLGVNRTLTFDDLVKLSGSRNLENYFQSL